MGYVIAVGWVQWPTFPTTVRVFAAKTVRSIKIK